MAAGAGDGAAALRVERLDDGARLCIGGVELAAEPSPARPELVPDPLFYENEHNAAYLRDLVRDLAAGERHLLLIGNQGTGKNKLADRLLHLLGWEREYMQLHRDSTVQSLTVVPTLVARATLSGSRRRGRDRSTGSRRRLHDGRGPFGMPAPASYRPL